MNESFPTLGQAQDAIRVLFVEDDQNYCKEIGDELARRGFFFQGCADGLSLFSSLESDVDTHIIILAWHLPKMLGVELLLRLRQRGVNLPVVFLTDHTLPANESLALKSGAIDFIDRARGIEVLVRRLIRIRKASQSAADAEQSKECGKLTLRPSVSRAHWDGTDLGLTIGEYNIVSLLALNIGKFFTYRLVYDRLRYEGFIAGSGPAGYRQNVRSAIKRIRNKFRDLDPTFVSIETFTSFGYRWTNPDQIN
jgi:two-component system, OmpR family, response regulator ChvI